MRQTGNEFEVTLRERGVKQNIAWDMNEKNCLVRLKASAAPIFIRAAKAEIHGEHLVFLRSSGEACALFLLELVEDWPDLTRQAEARKILGSGRR